jgi:hypothetical protein
MRDHDLASEYSEVAQITQKLFDSRLLIGDIKGCMTEDLIDMAENQLWRRKDHFSKTGFNKFLYDTHIWCHGDVFQGSLDKDVYEDVAYWTDIMEELRVTAREFAL